jgi:hypothetical protein
MESGMRERLSALLLSLDQYIELTNECKLTDAARLLSMAKLDLQMRLHGIGDDELRKFSQMLDEKTRSGGCGAALAATAAQAADAVSEPAPCVAPERRRGAARPTSRPMPN